MAVMRFLFAVLSLLLAKVFAYAPLRWMQTSTRGLVLLPEPFAGFAKKSTVPQKLVVKDPDDDRTFDMIPYFTAKPDNTISLDGMDLCMESHGPDGDKSGDAVWLNRCTGGHTQQWNWIPDANGMYSIQSKDTGRCLEVDSNVLNAVSIVLRKCENNALQTWKFEEPVLAPIQNPSFRGRHFSTSLIALVGAGMLSLRALFWWRKKTHPLASRTAIIPLGVETRGETSLVSPLTAHESSAMIAHGYSTGLGPRSAMWNLGQYKRSALQQHSRSGRHVAMRGSTGGGQSGATSSLPPLQDRVFLVTGSTDGIGEFTAELLAKQGCTVLVHGRSPAKVANVVETLKQHNPKIHGFVADLSRLGEVRRLAAEVKQQFPVIHGLANNAGTFAGDYTGRRTVTDEGNEYSLAVNVLAPFLLTSLLLENVRASGGGRVLVTSSISAGSNEKLTDLQCEKGWSDHTAYELSKLCCAMIVMECHARYGDPPNLTFHTMDPGTVNTKMLRAGWGGGPSVRTATATFERLTEDQYQTTSGTGNGYCRGEGPESRARLWQQLEQLTDAQWAD